MHQLSEMTSRWTLIQRAEEADKDRAEQRTGVDRVLDLDYMGSAEFEFGAVPKSIKAYREAARSDLLGIYKAKTPLKVGTTWWILMPKTFDQAAVEAQICAVSTGKVYTKESTYFDYYLNGSRSVWRTPPRATTWFVLTDEGRYQQNHNFVMWSLNKATLTKLLTELKRETPTPKGEPLEEVKPLHESLRVFDKLKVRLHDGSEHEVTLVGIHEKTLDVKLSNDKRVTGLPYTAIIQ